MSARSIPTELEPAIAELIKQKKSTYYIAEWLQKEHGITTSHMSVHRTIERIRLFSGEPDDLESAYAELEAETPHYVRTLKTIVHQLGDIADKLYDGDAEKGVAANPNAAGKVLERRARIVSELLRYKERMKTTIEHRKRLARLPPLPERPAANGVDSASRNARIDDLSRTMDQLLRPHEGRKTGS